LTGQVRPVKGVLPIASRARAEKRTGLLLPVENAAVAAIVEGLRVIPVENLRQAGHPSRTRAIPFQHVRWIS
jgi:magnesium chelatase family protein